MPREPGNRFAATFHVRRLLLLLPPNDAELKRKLAELTREIAPQPKRASQ